MKINNFSDKEKMNDFPLSSTKNISSIEFWKLDALEKQEEESRKIDKIKEIYTRIYLKYRNNISDEVFITSKWLYPFRDDNSTFELVSWDVWQYYDAHGIDKWDQLSNLINLLSNWIDKSRSFFTAPFEITNELKKVMWPALWTAGWTAYKTWIATLVSSYKKSLLKDGISYIFINDVYEDLLEHLIIAFPEYNFHLLSEQKKVLENWINLVKR